MIKKILFICGVLALCACIAVVPCFAIQSGFFNGQELIHVLGAQYQISLMGTSDDALVLFDTRGLYWWAKNDSNDANLILRETSFDDPNCFISMDIISDLDASIIYNDFTLTIDDNTNFSAHNTYADVFMISDRFTLGSNARLGLHLNPIQNTDDGGYLKPAGDTVSATVLFCALTIDGEVIEVPMYRDDLIVGGTYDLTARLDEFFGTKDIQYYWIVYEGSMVVPTFVQDFSIKATLPWTDVRIVDWATDIVYPEVISYEEFNLLSWLGAAIDGFLTTTIFSVGGIDVSLGVIFSVPLTIMILIVFLKKFAGG